MKTIKVIGKIFAILFSIFYFFAFSLLMIVAFANNLLSGDYYAGILKNIDLNKIKVSELGEFFNGAEVSKDASVEEALVSVVTKSGVEEKTAVAVVENDEIREIIGNFIGDYINYKVGGSKPEIKKSDVENLLTNPDVIRAIGKKPSTEEIDKIYNQLNDFAKEAINGGGVNNGNSKRTINNNIDFW